MSEVTYNCRIKKRSDTCTAVGESVVGAEETGARVVGLLVGESVGTPVGEDVGADVGALVGTDVGALDGTVVGVLVITSDGCNDGATVSDSLGTEVSSTVGAVELGTSVTGANVAGRLSMGTSVVAPGI
jgi:hypothetical protein